MPFETGFQFNGTFTTKTIGANAAIEIELYSMD